MQFSSASPTLAAYETAWGGIINKAGYNNECEFFQFIYVSVKLNSGCIEASTLAMDTTTITTSTSAGICFCNWFST